MSSPARAAEGAQRYLERVEARLPGRVRHIAARAREDDIFLHAAALAFYGLVSVAPLVVVALWLVSLVVGDDEVRRTAEKLGRFAPRQLGADRALERVADVGTRAGVVAVVAALWPATAYGAGLVRVFDRLSEGAERELKGLRGRGLALCLVGLVPALILSSLLASYVGVKLLGDGALPTAAGLVLALALGFLATAAAVTLIYKVFPHRSPPWHSMLRGTVVAAGGTSLLSVAYVAYLRLGADFEQRYTSDAVAAIVLLALWLFLANVALLVGYKVATET
ncbi:MAG: YihY/virulence factor BrkB family protein [Actinomycetota bacterium]|nr:YihY/virulence factor BrkB family protein [Actinomycetota bacterium]